ncbi:MAG: urease accessory protein UreF [Roseovarius sp.]
MPTDTRLLTLMQWLSPAYPLGSFAYSHGLESAVAKGWVKGPESLKDWLEDVLCEGTGRNDAILLRQAFDAPDAASLAHVEAVARAACPSAERLREAGRQGAAFARVTAEVWQIDLPSLLFPVAVGRAARLADLDPEITAMLFLQGFASNLVSAAQRLMPLGQTEAQRVLSRLAPACQRLVHETAAAPLDEIASNAFLSDVASLTHETLEPRIFQS